MKQSLQFKFSQNLSLTPQLQQSIRLLQLSTLELNEEIETLLQENPLLELADSPESIDNDENANASNDHTEIATSEDSYSASITDTIYEQKNTADSSEDFDPSLEKELSSPAENFSEADFNDTYEEYASSGQWDESGANPDEDNEYSNQEAAGQSLREYLHEQLKLMPLSKRDLTLALILVDTINDDGYLDQPLEELAEMLPDELEVDAIELQTVLKLVQHLDPPGIGARDLVECLMLQFNSMPTDTDGLPLAKMIVAQHLATLAGRDFAKLRKMLQCNDAELKIAQQLIKQLKPKPGAEFAPISSNHYIQHEVLVKKMKGVWVASLNEAVIPKLRINQLYANILKRNRDSSNQYLASQMQEAKWMIKNIQQRFSTILRVSQAIVDRQRNFFEHGDIAMRPLVLREIAEELELHESTISRVTTHKYMLTPRGIYELKYFFGSHVSTDSGGACSATAIRALIKQLIAEENSKKPLSDNQLTDILSKQGIVVARRTVAKYRESLLMPPTNLRKSL